VPVKHARSILKSFIDQGDLSYEYEFRATYVAQNFLKPVNITRNFILIPPGKSLPKPHDRTNIIIEPGISFRSGSHPTTRLCLEVIETVFVLKKPITIKTVQRGADYAGLQKTNNVLSS
jgi:ribosomal protein L11 methyltransferase